MSVKSVALQASKMSFTTLNKSVNMVSLDFRISKFFYYSTAREGLVSWVGPLDKSTEDLQQTDKYNLYLLMVNIILP